MPSHCMWVCPALGQRHHYNSMAPQTGRGENSLVEVSSMLAYESVKIQKYPEYPDQSLFIVTVVQTVNEQF